LLHALQLDASLHDLETKLEALLILPMLAELAGMKLGPTSSLVTFFGRSLFSRTLTVGGSAIEHFAVLDRRLYFRSFQAVTTCSRSQSYNLNGDDS
jgi:hypothetical protein